jgi:lipooligosaccharide transport system permease protein
MTTLTTAGLPAWRAAAYWIRQYTRVWRGTVVISIANPVLFLIGIGAGLGKLVDHHAPAQIAGVPYLAFFAPGLLAAATMQTAFLESSGRVRQAASWGGSYRDAALTPLEPRQIMDGHLLFILFRVVTSAAAFLAVMAAFGACRSWWALAVLPAATLTGLAFTTATMAWAVTATGHTQINNVFRFVIIPLYMFSGTFFAIGQLPGWLLPVAYVTPLYHGVALCRTLSLGTATLAGSAVHLAYLVVMAVGGYLLARVNYRRVLHP